MASADSRSWSMYLRALLTGAAIVAVFMVLVGVALERAYRDSVITGSRERLQARIYMLMSAAEFAGIGELSMPAVLPSPELSVPDSGVLAAITDSEGAVLWRSESSLVATLVYPSVGQPGQPLFGEATTAEGSSLYTLSYPVIWELAPDFEYALIFHAAEDTAQVDAEVAAFRDTLMLWLGAAGLLLLVLQSVLLSWVLRPLRRVANEVEAVESGEREQLAGDYPRELLPLTRNLNAMLRTSQSRTNRYRNALADLAHSLKTPLAVLRNRSSAELDSDTQRSFTEQLDRMDVTITYQLQRAALSGRSPLAGPVDVAATVNSIVDALGKVYHSKGVQIACTVPDGVRFTGDTGDLAELLGNLGDNACKWCESQVAIHAVNEQLPDGTERLVLTVEDDGPGIPAELRNVVTERGIRADSTTPGQGIGLAIVRDIVVEAYGGELRVETSALGGALIRIRL